MNFHELPDNVLPLAGHLNAAMTPEVAYARRASSPITSRPAPTVSKRWPMASSAAT